MKWAELKPFAVFGACLAAGIAALSSAQPNGMPSTFGWIMLLFLFVVLAWAFR